MEGRVDHIASLDLWRPLDKSGHGLQHFGVGIGVVRFRAGLVVPETDGCDIDSARTGERNFATS